MLNRREFIGSGAAGTAAFLAGSRRPLLSGTPAAFKLAIASYTFRAFDLDQTLEGTQQAGTVSYCL
ncbi:MAG: hypothetical protein U5R06_12035 [candidate division KSB1 bacterium]|nr:hypothetical protein [candidate division KSB1 bacterium]